MNRRQLLSMTPVRFALLFLIGITGLSATTHAQVQTTCATDLHTSSGTPMTLHLNSTADANGNCVPDTNQAPLTPGTQVGACYDSSETTATGYRLNHLTNCTVCAPDQPGCFTAPTPTTPTLIPPGGPGTPPIWPYNPWDPWNPYPWNPWNPWDPWGPWVPGSLPPDYGPNFPPYWPQVTNKSRKLSRGLSSTAPTKPTLRKRKPRRSA